MIVLKTAQEIALMRQAGKIVATVLAELKERDPAFRDLARWISPGTVGHLPAG